MEERSPTGRLPSHSPLMLQHFMPRTEEGQHLRDAFGKVDVAAAADIDLSAVELRILAAQTA